MGGGFAGIHAAKGLGKLPVDVTVIDRRNHHTFQPLLYQVALAVLSPADIAQPIRSILRGQQNTQVLMDEVVGIDTAAQVAVLGSGSQMPYDYLVLAAGATHSYFGHDEWAKLAPGLKSVEDATEIRRRVLLAFELAERHMQEHGWHPPLNFVVIGGGPTGVELAGAIRDISQYYMRNDFRHIDPTEAKVLLLDGGKRVLAAYPEDLSAKAEKELEDLGVEVHLNCQVTNVGPGYVETGGPKPIGRRGSGGDFVGSGRRGLAAGQAARACPRIDRGCVMVDDQLNPASLPMCLCWAIWRTLSRTASRFRAWRSRPCRWATTWRRCCAPTWTDEPRPAFRYFDKGDMATIGRMTAVADVKWPFKAHMSGLPAWLTWIVVHIFFLIGFRNRVEVMASWMWTYFTFTRGARLITGDQRLPGWAEQVNAGPARPEAAVNPGAKAAD